MGYILIKYYDITEDDDFKVILTERLEVENGEYLIEPKEFKGYKNVLFGSPPVTPPDICDEEWIPPLEDEKPYGSRLVNISSSNSFAFVEFFYKKGGG